MQQDVVGVVAALMMWWWEHKEKKTLNKKKSTVSLEIKAPNNNIGQSQIIKRHAPDKANPKMIILVTQRI